MMRIKHLPIGSKFQFCGEVLTLKESYFVGPSQYIDDNGSLIHESLYSIEVLDSDNKQRTLNVDGDLTVAVPDSI